MANWLWAWLLCCLWPCCFAAMAGLDNGNSESLVSKSNVTNSTFGAIISMMSFYNYSTGLWDDHQGSGSPWWHSALGLQILLDWTQYTESPYFMYQINLTFAKQKKPLPWWPQGGGDFRADSTDDTAWWALAMTSLYEITGNDTFLDIAKEDEAYIFQYWTPSPCFGGLIWDIPKLSYKNAISNELYMELTATLHNLIPGDTYYLNRSLMEWEWFQNSGMMNPQNLINDGLIKPYDNDTCVNNNAQVWTYNQGAILGGLVQLYKATGETSYLDTACTIANAVIADGELSPNGTLTETCSSWERCDPDAWAFKGIFMRQLAKLDAVLAGSPYKAWINQNADEMYNNAKDDYDFYGTDWQGPFNGKRLGSQESAVMLLMATL